MTLPLKAKTIVTEVLDLLKPYSVYLDCFKFYQNTILFEGGSFDIKGKLHLFSLGKAASHELKALKSIIKSETSLKIASAVAYTKTDHLCDDDEIYQLAGSHPLLTEKNIELTKLFIDFISEIPKEDTLIFLLSGGGSALLELPVEGLSFQELQQSHKDILNSGLNINEMNQRRRELSLIKGGGLKNFIKTKNILQIITCDIPNEDPFDVSSGPLLRKEADENPKTLITQSASILLNKLTENENFINKGIFDDTLVTQLSEFSRQLPVGQEVFVSGGELTINIPKDAQGLGGRATHFVLSLASLLYSSKSNRNIHILSFGTDGTDGPTDAAGAYINYDMYNEEKARKALENFDSYRYFDDVGGLIKTGPTMNNLMDIRFIWREN